MKVLVLASWLNLVTALASGLNALDGSSLSTSRTHNGSSRTSLIPFYKLIKDANQRSLQNVFLHRSSDGDVRTYDQPTCTPTMSPTMSPTSAPTHTHWTVARCPARENSDESASSSNLDVFVEFIIETSASDSSQVEETVARIVQDTTVAKLAQEQCIVDTGRMLKRTDSRILEVIAVYTEHAEDHCMEECEPLGSSSQSCTGCSGLIKMQYSNAGANSDPAIVRINALGTIEKHLKSEELIVTVNDNEKVKTTGIQVTRLDYVGPSTNALLGSGFQETPQEESNGITAAGKAVISLLSLAVLVVLLLLCCVCRSRRKKINEVKSENREGRAPDDDHSYRTSDFSDISRYHSNLDVHHCRSATCLACQGKSTGEEVNGTHFVKAEGDSSSLSSLSILVEDQNVNTAPVLCATASAADEDEENNSNEEVTYKKLEVGSGENNGEDSENCGAVAVDLGEIDFGQEEWPPQDAICDIGNDYTRECEYEDNQEIELGGNLDYQKRKKRKLFGFRRG